MDGPGAHGQPPFKRRFERRKWYGGQRYHLHRIRRSRSGADRMGMEVHGSRDDLTSIETIRNFAKNHHAILTIMEGGEHWFHTEKQMRFLDDWIMKESHQ